MIDNGQDARYFDTVAAAYAASGDFTQAAGWANKAIAAAKSAAAKQPFAARD